MCASYIREDSICVTALYVLHLTEALLVAYNPTCFSLMDGFNELKKDQI